MTDDLFKMVGIIIFSFFIVYIIVKLFKLQANVIEGLTTGSDTSAPQDSTFGEAGSANNYAANIKAKVVQLQDELLIAKYRQDYENAILNLDDYVGYLMIKTVLNMNINSDVKSSVDSLAILNTLKTAKDSLNSTIAFLDKQ